MDNPAIFSRNQINTLVSARSSKLLDDQLASLSAVVSQLVKQEPFLFCLISSVPIEFRDLTRHKIHKARPGLQAAQDGKNIYLNLDREGDLKRPLLHALFQIINNHAARAELRDTNTWDVASGLAIDSYLARTDSLHGHAAVGHANAGIANILPQMASLTSGNIDQDLSTEYIYELLRNEDQPDKPDPQPVLTQGEGPCNSEGNGDDDNDPNSRGNSDDNTEDSPSDWDSDFSDILPELPEEPEEENNPYDHHGGGYSSNTTTQMAPSHTIEIEPAERSLDLPELQTSIYDARFHAKLMRLKPPHEGFDTLTGSPPTTHLLSTGATQDPMAAIATYLSAALTPPIDYSMRRPNRRYLATLDIALPRLEPKAVPIVHYIAIDVSSSISMPAYAALTSHALKLMQEHSNHTYFVLYVNSDLVHWDIVQDPHNYRFILPPGGATSYAPAFNFAKNYNLPPPTSMVYLTDLECSFPSKPDFPILWILQPGTRYLPPYGEIVRLHEDDLDMSFNCRTPWPGQPNITPAQEKLLETFKNKPENPPSIAEVHEVINRQIIANQHKQQSRL